MKNPIFLNFLKVIVMVPFFCSGLIAQQTVADQGTLTVTTVPAGMNVYVDGKLSGKSPLIKMTVSSGNRIVSIETEPCYKRVLFYSWNRSVYVEKGTDATVEIIPEPILTNLKVGEIEIDGKKIEGGAVYVDSVNVGTQPGSFDVPVCSKLLEVTEKNNPKVIYSSSLDLLKGKITQRNEKSYEIAAVNEKSPEKTEVKVYEKPETNGDSITFKTPEKKKSKVLGPYKWIGTGLIITGAIAAGLGGFLDYKSMKEFEEYEDMGDKETIRDLIEAGSFDMEEYVDKRDGHYKKGKDYSIARTVLYSAGGALFVTGVILLFIPEKKKVPDSSVFMIIPSMDGINISAEISF